MTSQVAPASSPAGQAMAIIVPKKVATPLPPLKRSQTGKRWPTNAAPPAIACASALRKNHQATPTASAPLPPSPSSVISARSRRPVRSTLVAPMLPEPIWRRSPAPASRVAITPNGIEPRK